MPKLPSLPLLLLLLLGPAITSCTCAFLDRNSLSLLAYVGLVTLCGLMTSAIMVPCCLVGQKLLSDGTGNESQIIGASLGLVCGYVLGLVASGVLGWLAG